MMRPDARAFRKKKGRGGSNDQRASIPAAGVVSSLRPTVRDGDDKIRLSLGLRAAGEVHVRIKLGPWRQLGAQTTPLHAALGHLL